MFKKVKEVALTIDRDFIVVFTMVILWFVVPAVLGGNK